MGLHLFNRVVNQQKQLDEEGPATKALIALVGGKDPRAGSVVGHPGIEPIGRSRSRNFYLEESPGKASAKIPGHLLLIPLI